MRDHALLLPCVRTVFVGYVVIVISLISKVPSSHTVNNPSQNTGCFGALVENTSQDGHRVYFFLYC